MLPQVHFGFHSLTARIHAAPLTARCRKLSELTSAVRRARAMPLCGNLYLGNTLRALAGDVTLRWEIATADCRSREIGDTPWEGMCVSAQTRIPRLCRKPKAGHKTDAL